MVLRRPDSFRGGESVPELDVQIAEHNRSCWMAAALSFGCAGLGWALAAALYAGVVLLVEAAHLGGTFGFPSWFLPVGLCGVGASLAAALIDRRLARFKSAPDRPIVGGHLIAEVVLLPARATLLVWDHLDARIELSHAERAEAWVLTRTILRMQRADCSLLARDFPDPAKLSKMLLALQLAGWIDLYRGEEGFYYRVRSDCEASIRLLAAEGERS